MAVDMSMPILIVDDYKTMLRIIRNLLKQLGFENVDEATDGSQALQKLRQKPYSLVISDWNMEPMTGLQLLKEVRADSKLKETPFIMVTRGIQEGERDRRQAGGGQQLHRQAVQRRYAEGQADVRDRHLLKPGRTDRRGTRAGRIQIVSSKSPTAIRGRSPAPWPPPAVRSAARRWRPSSPKSSAPWRGGDLSAVDLKVYGELEDLALYIRNARAEIAAIRPSEIQSRDIPTATDELDAVVGATEKATGEILDCAEQIQTIAEGLEDAAAKDQLVTLVTNIFEASNFQDITGQRITKVVKTLKHIEAKIDALVEAMGEEADGAQGTKAPATDMSEPADDETLPQWSAVAGRRRSTRTRSTGCLAEFD